MTHQANEYITLNIYLPEIDGRIAHIKQEFHLVDDLKANVLIETDILVTEETTVKLQPKGSVAIIRSCTNITILLSMTTRSTNQTNRTVTSKEYTVVPSHTHISVPIMDFGKMDLPHN